PQVAPARRPAALERARKYTEIIPLVEDETRAALAKPGLLPPSRIELDEDLRTASFLIDGIEKLFKQFEIPGHEEPVAKLQARLRQYVDFVKAQVLPRAREDFRIPPELYAYDLEVYGVDLPPAEVAALGHAGFT